MKKILLYLIISSFIFASFGMAKTLVPKNVQQNSFFSIMSKIDIYGEKVFYNKKIYLLDVWSITCPPCRLTIPELIAVQKELGGIDFMVIGLSLDEDLPAVKKFLDKESSNYHTVQATAEIMKKLPPVRGIPTLFLLDAKGKILKTYVGYTTRDVFKKDIRNLLNK